MKKGQSVQVIYGPHVTVIKAKLEEYLETAPNEFAEDAQENVLETQNNSVAETENVDNAAQASVPVKEEKIRKTAQQICLLHRTKDLQEK